MWLTHRMATTTDINEIPEIKAAREAWDASKAEYGFKGSPELHNAWVRLVKEEQVRRGQRRSMTGRPACVDSCD